MISLRKLMCELDPCSGSFKMVLGFSGASTIPHIVGHSLASFAAARAIEELAPEEAIRNTIVNDTTSMKSTSYVYVTPGLNPSDPPVAIQLGCHCPPDNVWGVELPRCVNLDCDWAPADSVWDSMPPFKKARASCLRCTKVSSTIWRELDLPSISPWGPSHPRAFKSVFPLPLAELNVLKTIGTQPERNANTVKQAIGDLKKAATEAAQDLKRKRTMSGTEASGPSRESMAVD